MYTYIFAMLLATSFLLQLNGGPTGYRNGGIEYDDLSTTDLSECCHVSAAALIPCDWKLCLLHSFYLCYLYSLSTVDIQRKNSCLITEEFFANVAKCRCDVIHFCVTSHASYSFLFGHWPWSNRFKISHSKRWNEWYSCTYTLFFLKLNSNSFAYWLHWFWICSILRFSVRIELPIRGWLLNAQLVMSIFESLKFHDNKRILCGSGSGRWSCTHWTRMGRSVLYGQFHRCTTCANAAG